MHAARQIPVEVSSLYEIGYFAMGRSSIYLISVVLLINSFGSMLVYFITFSNTLASIIFQLVYHSEKQTFFTSQLFCSITLGILLLPVVLMKELKEFKAVSVILFVSLAFFVLVFFIDLCDEISENPEEDF